MIDRLNETMDFIESHLDESIEIADLARIAVTSEYHFRRMFSALAGMPLSEYIRRRRLTIAGAEVVSGDGSLLDVAVRHGYGSSEAFARAFRAMHGIGPSQARRTGAALLSQPRMTFHLTIEGSNDMRYRIVHKDEFRVVGLTTRVPLIHLGVNPVIAEFVDSVPAETSERLKELSDQEPRGILAVTDNADESGEEGTELDYYHGVVTNSAVPEGMGSLEVAAGDWAVFESSGEFPSTLQYMWRDVYTEWFPSNPYRSAPGPSLLRMRLSDDMTEGTGELWIPVEKDSPA